MSKGEKLSSLDKKLLTFPIFQELKIHTVYENETHSEIPTWDARFPGLPLNMAVHVFRFSCNPIFFSPIGEKVHRKGNVFPAVCKSL